MTKEVLAVIAFLVTFLTAASGGIWTFSKMDSRIEKLEEREVWRGQVDKRLDTNDRRWAKHFNLWGDEIREAERRHGQAETDWPEWSE